MTLLLDQVLGADPGRFVGVHDVVAVGFAKVEVEVTFAALAVEAQFGAVAATRWLRPGPVRVGKYRSAPTRNTTHDRTDPLDTGALVA
ncbi:hypothetical protein [Amycolatopsis coloradensis]|uniref:hypothetical protein n=1 Tax=Amycolatopsis coloradensis TaxID=76021 RepID=UPI001178A94E|nr:hypothetical protein [Amycolatopsis coloradensis]